MENLSINNTFLKERIIFLLGEINDSTSMKIVTELLYLDSLSNDDITIYINSPGGVINAGLAIIDTINYIKSDVRTLGIGTIASMATLILAAGKKGKRMLLPNTEVMIHQPLGGGSGQATDIQIMANRITNVKKKVNEMLADYTGQKISKISKDTERDNYMSSEQALEYGLVDKIIKKGKDS